MLQFQQFDVVSNPLDHHYVDKNRNNGDCFSNVDSAVHKKIMKEWKILKRGLPEDIYVRAYEDRIDLLRALIVGPPGTPYHDGLFFFDLAFPSDYPLRPPQVYYHSHGLRLNPNLYEGGYVCLSIINTWSGDKDEKWNSSMSTILQVLVSIQGLVLNDSPYFNEPYLDEHDDYEYQMEEVENEPDVVYESEIGEEEEEEEETKQCHLKKSMAYNGNAFALSCKTMLYVLRNPPLNFEGFVADHFRKRGNSIIAAVIAYRDGRVVVGNYVDHEHADGSSSSSNSDEVVRLSPGFKSSMDKLYLDLQHALAREPEQRVEKRQTEPVIDEQQPEEAVEAITLKFLDNMDLEEK